MTHQQQPKQHNPRCNQHNQPIKQQQTRQHSGSQYHLNLDGISYAALSACQQIHRDNKNPLSNSVIVRRALRLYFTHLEHLDGQRLNQEIIETKRAAKGIL